MFIVAAIKGHLDASIKRTASATVKPYQGDSFEFYLITVKKCSSQEVSKIILRLKIKISSLKLKDIKSKIKIQDHKYAKGTSKDFLSIQGSKIQDVTRSEALSEMTTT
ncbi:hypothetical protein Tco_1088090 [Tanacetum coccineum]